MTHFLKFLEIFVYIYIQLCTKKWRIFEIVSTSKMRHFLVHHCKHHCLHKHTLRYIPMKNKLSWVLKPALSILDYELLNSFFLQRDSNSALDYRTFLLKIAQGLLSNLWNQNSILSEFPVMVIIPEITVRNVKKYTM